MDTAAPMGMAMQGGASLASMSTPGQAWPGAAAAFLAMWVAMMGVMMLPTVAPALWRYRQALGGAGAMHPGRLTALVGAGYFLVWTVVGTAILPVIAVWRAIGTRVPAMAHAAPFTVGVIVLLAGAVQFTAWKGRRLHCCGRALAQQAVRPVPGAAWRHGLRLGLQCGACCLNLMVISLVLGMMDLRVMIPVTAAIAAERLAPCGARIARAIGVIVLGAGLELVAHAASVR